MRKILLILFIVLFTGSTWAATYYVDTTCTDTNAASATVDGSAYDPSTPACTGGSDDYYVTIADLNAKTFSAGDTIYFRKGQTWRERLNPVGDGSSGNLITFTSFGSGNDPKIKGSDLVATWTKASGDEFTDNFDDNDITDWDTINGGVTAANERMEVTVSNGGTDNAIEAVTARTEYWLYHKFYLVSGYSWSAGNDIQGKQLGDVLGCGLTNDSGTTKWFIHYVDDSGSNWVTDGEGPTDNTWHEILMYWKQDTDGGADSGGDDGIGKVWVDGVLIWSLTNIDSDTKTNNDLRMGNNYSQSGVSMTMYIDDLHVGTALCHDNIWSATLATSPNLVFFDDTQGTEEDNKEELGTANEWFDDVSGNSLLWAYSTSDPDNLSSPGVEAAVRDNSITTNDDDYISIDGLDLSHANGTGATGGAAIEISGSNPNFSSNWTIQNCTIHDNWWAGIYIYAEGSAEVSGFIITENTIYDNMLMGTGDGSAIYANFMDSSTISKNKIYNDGEHGIRIRNGDSNTIEYNESYNNGSSGCTLSDSADPGNHKPASNIVRYNLFHGNDTVDGAKSDFELVNSGGSNAYYGNVSYGSTTNGLRIDDCTTGDVFYNNTIYNAGNDGISVEGSSANCTFKNNIIDTSSAQHMEFDSGNTTGMTIDYNLYGDDSATKFDWGGSQYNFADWKTNSGQDANSPTPASASFTDAGSNDFTLQSTSPAKNAGELQSIHVDGWQDNPNCKSGYTAKTRLRASPDIGACESEQKQPMIPEIRFNISPLYGPWN